MLIFFQLLIQSCLKNSNLSLTSYESSYHLWMIIKRTPIDCQICCMDTKSQIGYELRKSIQLWTSHDPSLPSVVDSVCVQWKYTVCVQKKMFPHSDLVIQITSQYQFPPNRNPSLIWLEQKLSTKHILSDENTLNPEKLIKFMTDTFWKIKLKCLILITSKAPSTVISGYERLPMKLCVRY